MNVINLVTALNCQFVLQFLHMYYCMQYANHSELESITSWYIKVFHNALNSDSHSHLNATF